LPHETPSAPDVQALVAVAGWQLWQGSFGFLAPGACTRPSTKQPATHDAAEQICPAPHAVPSGWALKLTVDVAGWQLWQPLPGSSAPAP
jgi:hypothetical protein